jgi:hypothetical protein
MPLIIHTLKAADDPSPNPTGISEDIVIVK